MAEKKVRRKSLPLSPMNEVLDFVEEFTDALVRGEFDPYLYELVEAIDSRISDRMGLEAQDPDAFRTAFLKRVRHYREGAPALAPEACYELLGASYRHVVVRFIELYSDGKVRVEVLRNGGNESLVEGNTYRIPESALDRRVPDPEGR
jgi:hypothetical protein